MVRFPFSVYCREALILVTHGMKHPHNCERDKVTDFVSFEYNVPTFMRFVTT
jgi:hypothetical protein